MRSPNPLEVNQVTPQEEQLLNSLVERVNQTQLQEKDPDAEALLNRTLGRNPDALYMLAQTVLVQNIALDQAKPRLLNYSSKCNRRGNLPTPPAFWAACWAIATLNLRLRPRTSP